MKLAVRSFPLCVLFMFPRSNENWYSKDLANDKKMDVLFVDTILQLCPNDITKSIKCEDGSKLQSECDTSED